MSEITPSIVHGSSIGPASYVVNMADLKAVMLGNRIKFADDTYVVMPTANANSRQAELDSVERMVVDEQRQSQPCQVRRSHLH